MAAAAHRRPIPVIAGEEAEHEWHGWHVTAEFALAVRAAAATLPEHLRERALIPRERDR